MLNGEQLGVSHYFSIFSICVKKNQEYQTSSSLLLQKGSRRFITEGFYVPIEVLCLNNGTVVVISYERVGNFNHEQDSSQIKYIKN